MKKLIYQSESFIIIKCCLEVHKYLGPGFFEVVYKDALMEELKKLNIPFEREKRYQINYKGIVLPHYFYADFVVMDKIILEIKSASTISNQYLSQGINYLKVSGNQLAIIVNFGESSLNFKRVILSNNKPVEENQFPLRSNF